jgi:hypothetical protein
VNDSSDDFFEMAEAQGLEHLRLHRRDGLIDSMNVARVTVIAISRGLMAFVSSILVDSVIVPAVIFASCST